MPMKIIVGLDGRGSGNRALDHAATLAKMAGGAEVVVVHVIEWSPYSFHTAEENAQRHKRREEEIDLAKSRIVDPSVAQLNKAGIAATGIVRHGDVADTINAIAADQKANHIVIGRFSQEGLAKRIFGSATSKLVTSAEMPVTVVN